MCFSQYFEKGASYMKIRDGFELINRDGQNLIVYTKNDIVFNDAITLNETMAFLWECIKNGCTTKERLLDILLNKYDISTVLALNDIDIFVKTLNQNGILEE